MEYVQISKIRSYKFVLKGTPIATPGEKITTHILFCSIYGDKASNKDLYLNNISRDNQIFPRFSLYPSLFVKRNSNSDVKKTVSV